MRFPITSPEVPNADAKARRADRRARVPSPLGKDDCPVSSPTQANEEVDRLVEHCRNHDAAAQTVLRDRYHDSVLRAIRRYLARCRAARDLDEEAAATFWLELFYEKSWRLRAYRSERGSLESYLTGIARLSVLDFLDRECRQQLVTRPLTELDLAARPAEEPALWEALEYLCHRLPKGDRALLLSHLQSEPATPGTPSKNAEAIREAACLRQCKKRLLHKVLHILGLRSIPKKP